MSRCLWIGLVFAFIWMSPASHAAQPVGRILEVRGQVELESEDGKKVQAAKDMALRTGDTLETGDKGEVRFELTDTGTFFVASQTRVSVDEYTAGEPEEPSVLRMAFGYLWSSIRSLGPSPRELEIHTPTAICGVRGTEFETVAGDDGSFAVAVDQGGVEVTADGQTVDLAAGSMAEGLYEQKLAVIRAPERGRRDWGKWRGKRKEYLQENLPGISENAAEKIVLQEERIAKELEKTLNRANDLARAKKQLRALKGREKKRAGKELKRQAAQFRKDLQRLRREINKARAAGRLARRSQGFFERNRHQWDDRTAVKIEANLAVVQESSQRILIMARQYKKEFIQHKGGKQKGKKQP